MNSRFLNSINDISGPKWNWVCGNDYPFLRYEFFAALEDSGSTAGQTGWQPYHLVIESNDKVLGVMPLFLKYHSYGEYVFDWAWADAWYRQGYEYYPKFLNAIPFTPATGPRWGIDHQLSDVEKNKVLSQMLSSVEIEAQRLGISSCHWLFTRAEDQSIFQRSQYLQRVGCQYHWLNKGYSDFTDFLSSFTSRKRKTLKRERRKVEEQGIEVILKEGAAISRAEWDLFYQFYHLTYLKRSGHQGYLTEAFFPLLANGLSNHLMMIQAVIEGKMVAAALYFKDSQTLYGRYWGCLQEYDQLHFEVCYYQGIDYAIKNNLQRFDPGAQGEHKIQRGFTPVLTYSYHWVADRIFEKPLKQFLAVETRQIESHQKLACDRLPFKS